MRRRLPFLRTLSLLGLGLLVFAALVVGFGRIDRVVVALGRLEGGTVPVRATRDGVVERVLVRNGDRVVAGQELFRLESEALVAERWDGVAGGVAGFGDLVAAVDGLGRRDRAARLARLDRKSVV